MSPRRDHNTRSAVVIKHHEFLQREIDEISNYCVPTGSRGGAAEGRMSGRGSSIPPPLPGLCASFTVRQQERRGRGVPDDNAIRDARAVPREHSWVEARRSCFSFLAVLRWTRPDSRTPQRAGSSDRKPQLMASI